MNISVRYARPGDYPAVKELLRQVRAVHAEPRPDVFIPGTVKYDAAAFAALLGDDTAPVLVAVDENDAVVGHLFCQIKDIRGNAVLRDARVLFVDDLCIDQQHRAHGIGGLLMDEAEAMARGIGADRIELSVWACNPTAIQFYQNRGMTFQKHIMEMPMKPLEKR